MSIENEISAEFQMFMEMIKYYTEKKVTMTNLHSQMAALASASFIAEFQHVNSLDAKKTKIDYDTFVDLAEGKYENLLNNMAYEMSKKHKKMKSVDVKKLARNRFYCDIAVTWNAIRKKYEKRYRGRALPEAKSPKEDIGQKCPVTPNVTKLLKNTMLQGLAR